MRFNVLMILCTLFHAHEPFMFQRSISYTIIVLAKCLEFVGNGVNCGADLFTGVIGRDEESQAG